MSGLGGTQGGGSPPNPRQGAFAGNAGRGMGTFQKRPNTKPIDAPYTLTESAFENEESTAQRARLYEESVGFPNLAGDKFVAEQAKAAVLAGRADVFNVMEFLRNKWLILYNLYRGETLDQQTYGRDRMHSPEPFKVVETLHPKIMRTLFGNERWFKLYGEQSDHDSNAKIQEALCRTQLREMRAVEKAQRFIRDGLIYGTAIQKTFWKQELGYRRYRNGKRVPNPDFPGTTKVVLEEVKRDELVFDGNTVENVSIFDFMTSPSASSVEDAEWCADRSSWPDFKVKQMGELGHWINLQELWDHPGSNDTSFGDEFKERKSYAYGVFDPREASWAPHIPHYEVLDWWGPLVIKDERGNLTTRICNVVMIEPESLGLVVRVTENPFWHGKKPYQAWRPLDLEDEFYGIGALEMIARLSMEKDTKRNLLMASTQLEGNPMFIVSDEANIPDGQIIAQPGGTIRVPGDPSKAIVPLHIPQVSDAVLKAENLLTTDIRETAGATSPSMGAKDPFGQGKTATQHMAEIDEANLRLVPMIQNYELQVTVPMLDQMTWNNQQFQSYLRVVREIGALGMRFHDRYEIRPEDLVGRFLVQPLASHKLTTKQTQVQQLVNILDRAPIINQMYGPQAVNMPRLLAMILEQGFDIRNVDEFIELDDGTALTPIQEHQLWYHGNVPPVNPQDNNMRHYQAHMEEMGTPQFAELEKVSPGTAARARAHTAEHLIAVEKKFMKQEDRMQEFAQLGAQQGLLSGGSPIGGAAGPNQDPNSPQVRRGETERGESAGGGEAKNEAKSAGMSGAPNAGAQ